MANIDLQASKIITTRQVADALGWPSQRARRWLVKTGAGVKRGGRIITTPSRLAENFPEVWREMIAGPELVADIGDFRVL